MFIVFDIGGTKMRLAYSSDGFSFEEPVIVPTPLKYEDGIKEFKRLGEEISKGRVVKAIAGGIAGPFSERKASLVMSPNLGDWINRPFRQDLESAFSCPVHIENDAAMVALGEANAGAGRGFQIVAYMTVSTGVGGARIVNGRIDEKSIGFEIGHQIIDADRSTNKDPDSMFLDYHVSGKSIETRFGKKPKEISDPEFWNEVAKFLAYGLNNTIVHWSPDIVVLGGSMITGDPAISIEKTEEHLRSFFHIFPELPIIRKSELGDFGGLWGALSYLKQPA